MKHQLVVSTAASMTIPAVVAAAGPRTTARFAEFFTANIRNPNTRRAYGQAVGAFLAWCQDQGLAFERIGPVTIAGYVEQLLADAWRGHR